MPRNNGIYSPPSGTTAVSQTPISSAAYNNFVTDITADQNNPRPIIAGGTGAATAGGARTALGLGDAATRNVGTTAGTVAAGDDSRITGALPLDGSAAMTGPLTLPASTTAAPSLHFQAGDTPSAPVNGDLWADSGGLLRVRRGGVTNFLWDSAALALISKADAEAGTSTIGRIWSAERVAQAIAALTPPSHQWTELAPVATTSGTAVDWTSIPAGVTDIELWFDEISSNGTDDGLLQLGTGGVLTTSRYSGTRVHTTSIPGGIVTDGMRFIMGGANDVFVGMAKFHRVTGNTWVGTLFGAQLSPGTNQTYIPLSIVKIALTNTLDIIRLRLTGSNTFDAGSVQLRYR